MLSEKLKKMAEELKRKNSLEYLARNSDKVLGILYVDNNLLKYGIYENERIDSKNNHYLCDASTFANSSWAVFADEDEIYYDNGEKRIERMFLKHHVGTRHYIIQTIKKHKNRILDTGEGMFDILTDMELISEKKLKDEDIDYINSLLADQEDNLYALVQYNNEKNNEHGIRELIENSGKYKIGNEIRHYNASHSNIAQAQIIPYKNKGKEFSIISCVNLNYLDLDNEEIKGTRVKEGEKLCRVEFLGCSGKEAEIIYSGNKLRKIMYARIDLEKKEVVKNSRHSLIKGLTDYVSALALVRSPSLHEKLIKFIETKKMDI